MVVTACALWVLKDLEICSVLDNNILSCSSSIEIKVPSFRSAGSDSIELLQFLTMQTYLPWSSGKNSLIIRVGVLVPI